MEGDVARPEEPSWGLEFVGMGHQLGGLGSAMLSPSRVRGGAQPTYIVNPPVGPLLANEKLFCET